MSDTSILSSLSSITIPALQPRIWILCDRLGWDYIDVHGVLAGSGAHGRIYTSFSYVFGLGTRFLTNLAMGDDNNVGYAMKCDFWI